MVIMMTAHSNENETNARVSSDLSDQTKAFLPHFLPLLRNFLPVIPHQRISEVHESPIFAFVALVYRDCCSIW